MDGYLMVFLIEAQLRTTTVVNSRCRLLPVTTGELVFRFNDLINLPGAFTVES